MSDNVLSNSFFGNKDIPACEKLGAIALLLKGTYNKITGPDGKTQHFLSDVIRTKVAKLNDPANESDKTKRTSVYFTPGVKSLSSMACVALMRDLDLDKVFTSDLESVFSGAYSDAEIIEKLANECKLMYNVSGQGLDGINNNFISKNVKDYFKTLRIVDPNFSNEMENNLLGQINDAYGMDKKKLNEHD